MPNKFQVLVDSDAFVGWLFPRDPHFETVQKLFQNIKQQRLHLVTTSWVVAETATVLSHKQGQDLARTFLQRMGQIPFPTIFIDESLQQATTTLFAQQEKRGTSMVDCANVVVMRRFQIPQILSFDKAYAKQYDVATVA